MTINEPFHVIAQKHQLGVEGDRESIGSPRRHSSMVRPDDIRFPAEPGHGS